VEEAATVSRGKGIALPYASAAARAEEVCRQTAENSNSMLQDVLGRRRTELAAINGAIVREAEVLGIPTPLNAAFLALMTATEQTYARRVETS